MREDCYLNSFPFKEFFKRILIFCNLCLNRQYFYTLLKFLVLYLSGVIVVNHIYQTSSYKLFDLFYYKLKVYMYDHYLRV